MFSSISQPLTDFLPVIGSIDNSTETIDETHTSFPGCRLHPHAPEYRVSPVEWNTGALVPLGASLPMK